MKILGKLLLVIFCLGIATTFCGIALCDGLENLPQVQQTFEESVIGVEDGNELKLRMNWVKFYDMHGPLDAYLNVKGTNQYLVLDPTERLPNKYEVNVENECSYYVEAKFTLMLDGEVIETFSTPNTVVLPAGWSFAYDPHVYDTERYFSEGEHTASWLVQARRAGSGEEYTTIFSDSQSYAVQGEQQTIEELRMNWVKFYDMHGPLDAYLNVKGTNQYLVLDPTERLPNKYEVNVENECSYYVEAKFTLMLDGEVIETFSTPNTVVLPAGWSFAYDPHVYDTERYFREGEHTASWLVQARRAGSDEEYTTIFSDSQSYAVQGEQQ
jgi:hypothetical protein